MSSLLADSLSFNPYGGTYDTDTVKTKSDTANSERNAEHARLVSYSPPHILEDAHKTLIALFDLLQNGGSIMDFLSPMNMKGMGALCVLFSAILILFTLLHR